MSAANTQLAETVLISLLVTTPVVELTVVGAMSILHIKMVPPVRDALISVMTHGIAVTNTTHINAVLDGNVMKPQDNANQTWLEKAMAATLHAHNTATHTHTKILTDVIQQRIRVINVLMELLQAVEKKLKHVKIVKPHQRVNGNATKLTQNNLNVRNAKEALQPTQTAKADNKLVRAAIHLKRCSHVTKKHLHVKKVQVKLKLLVIAVVVILLQPTYLVSGED